MFFKKKEDRSRLPDLPPLPKSPAGQGMTPYGGGADPTLPAFPDSSSQRETRPGSEMIAPPGRSDVHLHPSMPAQQQAPVRVVEMEEWQPQSPQEGAPAPEAPEHPELKEMSGDEQVEAAIEEPQPQLEPAPEPVSEPRYIQPPPPKKVINVPAPGPADVFVRIDKFHSARRALNEIEGRLDDIDELVKKIRETKMREEQELAAWEKDLMHIKGRIQGVSENIFEKVE